MFKCEITGKLSRRGDPSTVGFVYINEGESDAHGSEKQNKIVVATRKVEYKHWDRENEEEWFSYGEEIVKEVNASDEGAAIWAKMTNDQRFEFATRKGWIKA